MVNLAGIILNGSIQSEKMLKKHEPRCSHSEASAMRQCILIYINNEQKMVKNLPTLLSSLDNNVVGKQKQFEWT
jgi:hypothetical protein